MCTSVVWGTKNSTIFVDDRIVGNLICLVFFHCVKKVLFGEYVNLKCFFVDTNLNSPNPSSHPYIPIYLMRWVPPVNAVATVPALRNRGDVAEP